MGTYINYATYINDGRSTPSPLFQGGTPGRTATCSSPTSSSPSTRSTRGTTTINLNWQITDNVSLLCGLRPTATYKNDFAEDTDGSPLAAQQLLQVLDHEQDDARAAIQPDGRDRSTSRSAPSISTRTPPSTHASTCRTSASTSSMGPTWCPRRATPSIANAELHLTDRLDLSLGVRNTRRMRRATRSAAEIPTSRRPSRARRSSSGSRGTLPTAACSVLDLLSVAYESDNTDYRVALAYDVGDSSMIYGQFATGYKAGGNNARPFFPSQLNAFDPETLDSYRARLEEHVRRQRPVQHSGVLRTTMRTSSCPRRCALGSSGSAVAVREPEQRRRCGRLGRRGRSRVAYHGCARDRRVVQHAGLRVLAYRSGRDERDARHGGAVHARE